jgi:hypothetical protein
METLNDVLWPIILIGGLGAFIDFLIAKPGQAKARDFLLKWWVRFDDVRWKNFGREEGLFAGRVIERWFGRTIWSFRRIRAAFVLFGVFMLVGFLKSTALSEPVVMCTLCNDASYLQIANLAALVIAFLISVSFTRFTTILMARLCGFGEVRNLLVFSVAAIMNYAMLIMWAPITRDLRFTFVTVSFLLQTFFQIPIFDAFELIPIFLKMSTDVIKQTIFESVKDVSFYPTIVTYYLEKNMPIDIFAVSCLSIIASVFRFILAIIFVGSFLARPFVMRPVSLIWARIVESDKPVFTLTFGGAAAFATAIGEAAKHL